MVLIDKPLGWSSFDVVKKVRNTLRVRKGKRVKVGHAGTLDPMATGLLILCTGPMTKQIDRFQAQEKEYEGELTLGQVTASYDSEAPVQEECDPSHLDEATIRAATGAFVGHIQQRPPIFSAIRVDGERLYKLARRGEDVEIKPRPVTIDVFEITAIDMPRVRFRVVCSKGTYIRSLAHDFGQALGVGAHLTGLRRTRIGDFHVDAARTIDVFVQEEKALHDARRAADDAASNSGEERL